MVTVSQQLSVSKALNDTRGTWPGDAVNVYVHVIKFTYWLPMMYTAPVPDMEVGPGHTPV